MKTNYFTLGSIENNRLVRLMQILLGVACIIVALFWLVFNVRSVKTEGTIWISIIFLAGFGAYQIWSGSGKATRFIEIQAKMIRLKRNAVLPPLRLKSEDIDKIDFYPLSLIFYLKSGKKILLRFGTVYYETNEKIVDQLIAFSESNNIPFVMLEDKL